MGSLEEETAGEEAGAVCPQGLRARWRASAGGGAAVRAGELREAGSRAGHLALGWDRT